MNPWSYNIARIRKKKKFVHKRMLDCVYVASRHKLVLVRDAMSMRMIKLTLDVDWPLHLLILQNRQYLYLYKKCIRAN